MSKDLILKDSINNSILGARAAAGFVALILLLWALTEPPPLPRYSLRTVSAL